MRCFTAAGIAKAKDFDDDMANILYKRNENLEDSEMVMAEYKQILNKISNKLASLEEAKEEQEWLKDMIVTLISSFEERLIELDAIMSKRDNVGLIAILHQMKGIIWILP